MNMAPSGSSPDGGIAATATAKPYIPKQRLEWVDAAKGCSILLVVAWHVFQQRIYVNELLVFVRMPLFFFVAGFFATKALKKSWFNVISTKVGHFFYIYFLWLTIKFFSTNVLDALKDGRAIDWTYLSHNIVEPASTLWFLYALAIIFPLAKLFSKLPIVPLFAMLIALYTACTWGGQWWDVPFLERFPRLTLFFAAGAALFPHLHTVPSKFDKWFPVTIAAFFAISYGILNSAMGWIAPLTLFASSIGIGSILLMSRAVQGRAIGTLLNFIGKRTLHIYVMHKIVMFYLNAVLPTAIKNDTWFNDITQFIGAVGISLVAGILLEKISPAFFEAPWVTMSKRQIAITSATSHHANLGQTDQRKL